MLVYDSPRKRADRTLAAVLADERRFRRSTVTDGLVRLDGYDQGWEVRSKGKVLARFYGTGSKRRAHLRYRQVKP